MPSTCLEPPHVMREEPSDPLRWAEPAHKQLVGYTDEQLDALRGGGGGGASDSEATGDGDPFATLDAVQLVPGAPRESEPEPEVCTA